MMMKFEFQLLVLAALISLTDAHNNKDAGRNEPSLKQHADLQEGSLFGYAFSDDYLFGTEQPTSLHSFPPPITPTTLMDDKEEDYERVVTASTSTSTPKTTPNRNRRRRQHHSVSPQDDAITKPVHRQTKRTTFLPYLP